MTKIPKNCLLTSTLWPRLSFVGAICIKPVLPLGKCKFPCRTGVLAAEPRRAGTRNTFLSPENSIKAEMRKASPPCSAGNLPQLLGPDPAGTRDRQDAAFHLLSARPPRPQGEVLMAWRHASCSAPRGFRDISTPWRGWHFLATLAALEQALSRPKANELPWLG